ncbi:[Protein-PII] uridylyltransferase [Triticum urartu]|uniref:ACT domain-containing protein ACR n=2 Tax=Triticum TaxID=4564 RepID=A0A9R0ZE41_TRITD|nr:[Protein-PII] uridylyltransferase [Triticum urartu]VAI76272.1 unnamed protein product [Triticum turgidum subsp. durum]
MAMVAWHCRGGVMAASWWPMGLAQVPGQEEEEAALRCGESLRQAAAEMEWLNEYEKLVIRMDTPKVVIDNAVCPTATLVQVDSARKRGVLLEAVQVLADLDLSINKAYISSDGRWFMDVFHVTDRLGRKLTDDSVITYIQQCPDRPKLLYDVVCTLTDMDYLVFHGTIDTNAGQARQEFYIRHADGSPIRSEAEMQRGVRLELCTPDRPGLLSDVTRTFRENGLLVAQAEVSTKGDMATNVFYVTGTTAGQAVQQNVIEAVREKVGVDCLVVEEHRPQLYQKARGQDDRDDRNGAGIGLFYLGNLVKRNLYNLGLIKSCS